MAASVRLHTYGSSVISACAVSQFLSAQEDLLWIRPCGVERTLDILGVCHAVLDALQKTALKNIVTGVQLLPLPAHVMSITGNPVLVHCLQVPLTEPLCFGWALGPGLAAPLHLSVL